LTPGGLGFVEGVLTIGLVAAGGDRDEVAAAVVVYRALTWALPILVGVGCYVWWRRQSWPASQDAQSVAKATRP
jgi:putative heme transporter